MGNFHAAIIRCLPGSRQIFLGFTCQQSNGSEKPTRMEPCRRQNYRTIYGADAARTIPGHRVAQPTKRVFVTSRLSGLHERHASAFLRVTHPLRHLRAQCLLLDIWLTQQVTLHGKGPAHSLPGGHAMGKIMHKINEKGLLVQCLKRQLWRHVCVNQLLRVFTEHETPNNVGTRLKRDFSEHHTPIN